MDEANVLYVIKHPNPFSSWPIVSVASRVDCFKSFFSCYKYARIFLKMSVSEMSNAYVGSFFESLFAILKYINKVLILLTIHVLIYICDQLL